MTSVYLSVDIEGITGVVHADMMMPGEREYDRGRRSHKARPASWRAGSSAMSRRSISSTEGVS